jgi:hypothetical protein
VDPKTMHAPIPVVTPEAEFSEIALQRGETGSCGFTLVVDTHGNPQNVKLVRCTDGIFSKNAEEAVRKYRFRPATTLDGKPVSVIIHIDVDFHLGGGALPPRVRLGWGLASPPGASTAGPDASGVYPLLKSMEAPKLTGLKVRGFEGMATWLPENANCDTILTVDPKGKVIDAQTLRCDEKSMEKAALETLKASKFSPGAVNGNPVPVRMLVRLVFQGIDPQPTVR